MKNSTRSIELNSLNKFNTIDDSQFIINNISDLNKKFIRCKQLISFNNYNDSQHNSCNKLVNNYKQITDFKNNDNLILSNNIKSINNKNPNTIRILINESQIEDLNNEYRNIINNFIDNITNNCKSNTTSNNIANDLTNNVSNNINLNSIVDCEKTDYIFNENNANKYIDPFTDNIILPYNLVPQAWFRPLEIKKEKEITNILSNNCNERFASLYRNKCRKYFLNNEFDQLNINDQNKSLLDKIYNVYLYNNELSVVKTKKILIENKFNIEDNDLLNNYYKRLLFIDNIVDKFNNTSDNKLHINNYEVTSFNPGNIDFDILDSLDENTKQNSTNCSFKNWIGSILQSINDNYIIDINTSKPVYCNIFPQYNGFPIFNPNGKYSILLYYQGDKVIVTIDDLIPCKDNGYSLFPNVLNDLEIYPLLLTKALIKLYSITKSIKNKSFILTDYNVYYSLTGHLYEKLIINKTLINNISTINTCSKDIVTDNNINLVDLLEYLQWFISGKNLLQNKYTLLFYKNNLENDNKKIIIKKSNNINLSNLTNNLINEYKFASNQKTFNISNDKIQNIFNIFNSNTNIKENLSNNFNLIPSEFSKNYNFNQNNMAFTLKNYQNQVSIFNDKINNINKVNNNSLKYLLDSNNKLIINKNKENSK